MTDSDISELPRRNRGDPEAGLANNRFEADEDIMNAQNVIETGVSKNKIPTRYEETNVTGVVVSISESQRIPQVTGQVTETVQTSGPAAATKR